MRKKAKFVVGLVGLMLLAMLSLTMFSAARVYDGAKASSRCNEDDSFRPSVREPALVDRDNNGIADSLDREIAGRSANGTAQEYVNVTVMLKSEPTARDADDFVSSGGYLTTSPWTRATYGFGGRIPYGGIGVFAQRCPDVLLVEEEAVCHSSVAYAATQVGARTYVWSGLGLQGDSNSSVAILDTGIDASHPDFSPGFGDQDFSEKIVGWNDQINGAISPFDDNGHGSHVSGLAAGDGFFSVDASGNAIDTWGANLGSVSSTGTYLVSGMMVNKTGTITLKVKWTTTGTAKLSALPLYYGEKTLNSGSWVRADSVSTPSQNTWYTLTYDVVSTPSDGYDMYHAMMDLTRGRGNLYVVLTMSWPYTPPADGFSAWTGIAPQAKLVGVKVLDYSGSGTSTGLINGINWIITNRIAYHITLASMSLGFSSDVSAVDSAVVNLVNSGVTTVVAAGNSGPGGNYVYSPGSVDEALTVAAMNQFDNTATYSSQGGTSGHTGQTAKPDITAPGGSFYGVPLLSADSNNGDADGEWPDVQADDAAPMQGTSMATPIVAGAADIVIQAIGGCNNWQWTRSQALQPKMILLMTATETYPNLREQNSSSTSPTLDRGGKDVHEGYGRLNLDAAADAVLKTYQIGTTVTDTLGKPPTLGDISVLGQRLAWARNVQLVSGRNYNFTLNVPAGADYDLYLYNSTGNTYGDTATVASSTTAATEGTEQFTVTAPYTGTYYLVVKRATETTGSGAFTVTSSGPVYLVVRGLDNGIYYRVWNETAWENWMTLPGSTIGSPAAAMLGNELHIVVRGSDGASLWYGNVSMNVNTTDGTFHGWTLLDGSTPSAPTLTSNGTVLCLVVRGEDDRIYYRCYNGSWGSWYAVPTGAASDSPAAAMLGNELHLVVRGMDGNSLWHVIVNPDTGSVVRDWTSISGATGSKPALAADLPDSELYLTVRGLDNAIYYRTYKRLADSWEGWNALPGATVDGPAVTMPSDKLYIVARGLDGDSLWFWDGTNWNLLSGATPSAPTLAG